MPSKREINIHELQHKPSCKKHEPVPDEIIKENIPLVEALASQISARGHLPIGIEFQDLVSWGTEGLMKAWKRFKADKGSKFKTYAYYRIRGEIYDRIRQEWQYRNPTDYYEYRKQLQARIANLAEEAITDAPDASEETLSNIIANSAMLYMVSLDNIMEKDITDQQNQNEKENEFPESMLFEEIRNLDQEERQIIELFYFSSQKQKEIANRLNYSRSKICRIHMNALKKLRRRLERRLKE